ncbi:molecular chaperone DnaJ [Euzebya tangerina]|uniref:molecular chaperone DnaJ n=1 Tax=Euzebya tangerina TaxID=591198 RepID=UPI000E30F567|nr:molecular chaperone DnaJ [Euzebya tangerina]
MSQADWLEKDYYKMLGVASDASADEIRKAYRKLARENHPDANPDNPKAEERFKEVSEANSVLSDPSKRAEYDQFRQLAASGGLGGGGFGGFQGGAPFGGSTQNIDLNDLLGNIFGGGGGSARASAGRGGRPTGPRRGNDVKTGVTLSFEDAMAGVTVTLRVRGNAVCSTCSGMGARPGTFPHRCDRCGGQGVVNDNQGLFAFSQPCPVCAGRGEVIDDPCPTCAGSGIEQRTRTVRTRLPAGVRDGQTVKLPGKGEPGMYGGQPGDLLVEVTVAEHDVFVRSGDNLKLSVPITFAEAALGAQISVPTLDGSVTLKIPAGTESGRTFRVRGRGAPKRGKGKKSGGDLLVTVTITVPQKLTKTQKKVVEDFAAMDDSDPRATLNALSRNGATADAASEDVDV